MTRENTQRARSRKPYGSSSSGRSESGDDIDPDEAAVLDATLGTRRSNAGLRSRKMRRFGDGMVNGRDEVEREAVQVQVVVVIVID